MMLNHDLAATDQRRIQGPFDIIGDVHGCCDELEDLLSLLGYRVGFVGYGGARRAIVDPPAGRRAIFVGDLTDRGPRSPDVLRIVMSMVDAGHALAVPGNHDVKVWRWLTGKPVTPSHGLDRTIEQMDRETPHFKTATRDFIAARPTYLWLDGGALAVAHAGIRSEMLGHLTNKIAHFCVYGDTDGKTDANGLAVRYNWAERDPTAETFVVYGHIPVETATFVNQSVDIDTGCCFGGSLTALKWPERTTVSVKARMEYYKSLRDFGLPPPRD
jgi:diadenosine tetraphosphatase ApaH/serine/threonine PP2A family protein phosphatase